MRLSTIFSIVFILHIHWVCGDTIVLPQSTEKDAIVETTPETEVKHSDDRKNISIAPGVAMNKLLAQEQTILEQEQESLESSMEGDSYESNEKDYPIQSMPYVGIYRTTRSLPNLHEKSPVQVRTFTPTGDLSACSCFCPPSRPCSAAAPIYIPPPPPPPPVYFASPLPAPTYFTSPPPSYLAPPPPPPNYPSHPSYSPPAVYGRSAIYPEYEYAYARSASEDDDNELMDSMTEEARTRTTYADEPAYPTPVPAAAPAQYAAPPVPQTYPSPDPSAKCGQNLIVGCSPTVTNVPCSASY